MTEEQLKQGVELKRRIKDLTGEADRISKLLSNTIGPNHSASEQIIKDTTIRIAIVRPVDGHEAVLYLDCCRICQLEIVQLYFARLSTELATLKTEFENL